MSDNDTIVAQATPPGRGGVGILRISGFKAREVAETVLGKLPKPRYADYLPFKDADGSVLDQAILSWVEEQGGIQVLLEKLQSGGLGAILSTWLSNQQGNQSVSGEQLESALGTNAVSDLGQKLGVDTSTASSLLAEQLPKIIDALSPQGEVSPQANNDLLSAGMELLKGKLFR